MSTKEAKCSDQEIVALYFARDERAIYETDRKYRAYLLTVANSLVGDREDAAECLNDTYLDVWHKIPPERPTHLKAFLAVIARRCSIDRYKKSRAEKRLPDSMAQPLSELEEILSQNEDPHTALEARELSRAISRFLKGLSEKRRYLFLCRYYDAKSTKTIAKEQHRTVSAINKELQKIRNELKDYLIKEGYPI